MENQYTCHNLSVRNKRQKSRFKFAGTTSILAGSKSRAFPTAPFFTKNNSNESGKSDFDSDFPSMRRS